jgi:hypothetical protein
MFVSHAVEMVVLGNGTSAAGVKWSFKSGLYARKSLASVRMKKDSGLKSQAALDFTLVEGSLLLVHLVARSKSGIALVQG